MLSIRLSRTGRKNQPSYRLVVMEKTRDPWARHLEILGHYNPRRTPREIVFNADRITHWISKGAEVSDTAWNLLLDQKIVEGKKRSTVHLSDERRAKLAETKKKDADAQAKAKVDAEAKAQAEKDAKQAEADAKKAEAAKPAEEVKPAEEAKPAEETK